MSLVTPRFNYNKNRSFFRGFDPILTAAVAALLFIGTLLVMQQPVIGMPQMD